MKKSKSLLVSLYLVGFALSIVMIIPFYWMVITGLKAPAEVITYPPIWIPSRIEWNNFKVLFSSANFGRYFLNSSIVSGCVVPSVLLTSSLAGFIFAKYEFRGKDFLFALVISTMMVPFAVIMIPLYVEMAFLGLINTYGGLIFPTVVNAFGIFLMRQFMLSIPNDLLDAARIDGCSDFRIYWEIVLPNVKAPLSALTIFMFLWSWDNFLWPLIITETASMRTLPVGIAMFSNQFWMQYHLVMAGAVVIVVPVLVVFFVMQKRFIQGIVLTGLKG